MSPGRSARNRPHAPMNSPSAVPAAAANLDRRTATHNPTGTTPAASTVGSNAGR